MAMAEQAAPRNSISTASGVWLNLLAWILIKGLVGWSAGIVARQPAFGCIGAILSVLRTRE